MKLFYSSCLRRPAAAAHRAQRPRPGVQGELQAAGRTGGVDGAHREEALVCGAEHSHLRSLRGEDPGQEQPGLGARAQDCERILRRGL